MSFNKLKYTSSKKTLKIVLLMIPVVLCELFVFQQFFIVSLSILGSFLIAETFEKIEYNSLKTILLIFISFHAFSFYSLLTFGVDLIPEFLYEGSRHLVGVNDLIKFRPSGIFLEPSTFAINYIALTILFLKNKEQSGNKNIYLLTSVVFSLLTFSVISVISLLILIYYHKMFFNSFLVKLSVFIIIGYLSYMFLISFVVPKINLYFVEGLENYARFELFFRMIEEFSLSPVNYVNQGVALDNGPIIYLLLFCGVYAIPLAIYMLIKSLKDFKIFLLILTKISVTYPLIWLILKKDEND